MVAIEAKREKFSNLNEIEPDLILKLVIDALNHLFNDSSLNWFRTVEK